MSESQDESPPIAPVQSGVPKTTPPSTYRQAILAVLADQATPMRATDLATHVAARVDGTALIEVTDARHREVQIALHHSHLPRLQDAGLIDYDDGVVTLREDPGSVDALSLSDHRQRILTVLADEDQELDVSTLATRLADPDQSRRSDDSLAIRLYHIDLPALDDAGHVAFDRSSETVALADHHAGGRNRSGPASGTDGPDAPVVIEPISGVSRIDDATRTLIQGADEEVQLVVGEAGLRDDWLDQLRAVRARGVTVSIGAANPDDRDRARDELPDAAVWPASLGDETAPDHLEGLLLVDGAAGLFATSHETTDRDPAVHAIRAAGTDNPLVVLMRGIIESSSSGPSNGADRVDSPLER